MKRSICRGTFAAGLLLLAYHHPIFADTSASESKLKIEDVQPSTPKAEDVDSVITNNLLRAESGSKSRYSIASTLNYNGGSVKSPFSEDRPNISDSSGTNPKSLLEGQVSAKMNLATQSSLMAGVGVRWIAPLQKQAHNYDGDRVDASNPYLTYQYVYKWHGVQSVLQAQALKYTNADLLREGYVGNVNVNQDNMLELGSSGFSVGASVYFQYAAFNKTGPLGQPGDVGYMEDVREDQSDYMFSLEPALEYQFNDTYNFRTVLGLWNYEHLRSESAFNTYHMDKVYQSVGLGISLTRDIYLYPNIQFLPDDIRSDKTNVALNTNINIF